MEASAIGLQYSADIVTGIKKRYSRMRKMNEKKIKQYFEKCGLIWLREDWSVKILKQLLKDNTIKFEGEETGYLKFSKSKSGRKYIQFTPGRCYLD